METYVCLITASIGVQIEAEDYKEAVKKGSKSAEDLQHATTGALKYLGIKWEVDSVLKKRDD
jgi:hypothetical protein